MYGPDANGHYWVVGPRGFAYRHKSFDDAYEDYTGRTRIEDAWPNEPTPPQPPLPGEKGFVPYQHVPPGYSGAVDAYGRPMHEAYEKGYRQALNERSGGMGGGMGGGHKPIPPELYYNPNGGGGGSPTPDPWYLHWLASYGQLWYDLMNQGGHADWSQLQGMVSGTNGWIFQTPTGNYNITWNGTTWVGWPTNVPWPE